MVMLFICILAFKHPSLLGSSERGVRNERESSAERVNVSRIVNRKPA